MYKSSFPGCCAGSILRDFGHTSTTSGTYEKIPVEQIRKWLRSAAPANSGFYIIAINQTQNKVLEPLLTELGWKCVAEDIKSPNHSQSKIFIWLKADYAKKKKAPSNSKSVLQKGKATLSRSK